MDKIKIWSIYCATGCTCCNNENFTHGFYKNKNDAQSQMDEWSQGINNPLASQYAKYGRYSLQEHEAELLGDGRMIVDGTDVYEEDYSGRIYD